MSETINTIDHTRLLPEHIRENPFYSGITDGMNQLINPVAYSPTKNLLNIRSPDVESYYASLNCRMLGFKIPSLAFSPEEYTRLMKSLGTYWLTAGASSQFIRFLCYIKNIELIYVPLWANSLDMPVNDFNEKPGLEIFNGGDWFPTPYYDIVYSLIDFPNVDETQFRTFLTQLTPHHLVLRFIAGIDLSTSELYISSIPLDRQRDTSIATA